MKDAKTMRPFEHHICAVSKKVQLNSQTFIQKEISYTFRGTVSRYVVMV